MSREVREQAATRKSCPSGKLRRRTMPVLLLWAVPAIVVVGGVGYYVLRAVH
jgi:hypothetical protein